MKVYGILENINTVLNNSVTNNFTDAYLFE